MVVAGYVPALQAASLVLAEDWESDRVSGHSANMFRLNAGEYTYDYEWPHRDVVTETRETREETSYAGLKGFSWWESGDKPCKIKAHPVALNVVDPRASGRVKSEPNDKFKSICDGRAGNEKKAKFVDGTDRYVRGVAVCTNEKKKSSDERLKGIRVHAAEVGSDGTVQALDVDRDDMHVNCKQWHAPVYCPAGHIVSGLQVHHRNGYFTGLGIKCRRVATAETPFKE
jgi:hypothetical protein